MMRSCEVLCNLPFPVFQWDIYEFWCTSLLLFLDCSCIYMGGTWHSFFGCMCVCVLYIRIQILRTCSFVWRPTKRCGIELNAYNFFSHRSCHALHLYHICKLLLPFKLNQLYSCPNPTILSWTNFKKRTPIFITLN